MLQNIGVTVENKVDRLGECNQNKRNTNEERWHVTPYDGGWSLSTGSWGGWTLALLGAMFGTNEPSIAPSNLAKPANA